MLYDADDESTISTQKRFTTTGVPAALCILTYKFCAAQLKRFLVHFSGCPPARLFNKGSPGKILTTRFFPFYLKNHLRLFPFLLFAPDSCFTLSVRKQPSLPKGTLHSAPLYNLISYLLASLSIQQCGSLCRRHETAFVQRQLSFLNSRYFLLYGILSSQTGYRPP